MERWGSDFSQVFLHRINMTPWAVLHALASACVLYLAFNDGGQQHDLMHSFGHFVRSYNRTYEYGTEEHQLRESIFKQNLEVIGSLNELRTHQHSAVYGVNKFADFSPEEFREYAGLKPTERLVRVPRDETAKPITDNDFWYTLLKNNKRGIFGLPSKVDWRARNVITPVNDQEECGACWAFSTVETIEAMYALKYGVLEKWSVQQILDCATDPNYGCEGGDTCSALEWLYENETSIMLEKDYPFTKDSGSCQTDIKSEKTVQIARNFSCDSFVDNELPMLIHLAYHGPLIAAVDATDWQYYVGGVLESPCVNDTNHAIQIVGYDMSDTVHYYIVRNSWGTGFGNNGYLKIAVGENACCIADEVSALDVM